jgi:hypothetical protein
LLLGTWVNRKLISGLEQCQFSNASEWIKPCRSFTFVKKNEKLICYYELNYEYVTTSPNQENEIQGLPDSRYFIHMKNADLILPNDFVFNKKDSTISIENSGKGKIIGEQYVKVAYPGTAMQPIDYLVVSKLLNGRFRIFDSKWGLISSNAVIAFNVKNFENYKLCTTFDLQFYEDTKGVRYPIFLFDKGGTNNRTSNSASLFAYKKDGNNIQLYSFKTVSRGIEYNTPIDSLVLKYTLVPIK